MRIDPKLVHLLADIETCGYKPGTREPDTGGEIGHMIDALGYPTYLMFPVGADLSKHVPKITIYK